MDIIKSQKGKSVTFQVSGRLDTTTSPQLETAVNEVIEEVRDLILDFEKLEYISSAGLRLLLSTQKKLKGSSRMTLINVSSDIMEVFDLTGFSDLLKIIS